METKLPETPRHTPGPTPGPADGPEEPVPTPGPTPGPTDGPEERRPRTPRTLEEFVAKFPPYPDVMLFVNERLNAPRSVGEEIDDIFDDHIPPPPLRIREM
jgi:hypothetical protein